MLSSKFSQRVIFGLLISEKSPVREKVVFCFVLFFSFLGPTGDLWNCKAVVKDRPTLLLF